MTKVVDRTLSPGAQHHDGAHDSHANGANRDKNGGERNEKQAATDSSTPSDRKPSDHSSAPSDRKASDQASSKAKSWKSSQSKSNAATDEKQTPAKSARRTNDNTNDEEPEGNSSPGGSKSTSTNHDSGDNTTDHDDAKKDHTKKGATKSGSDDKGDDKAEKSSDDGTAYSEPSRGDTTPPQQHHAKQSHHAKHQRDSGTPHGKNETKVVPDPGAKLEETTKTVVNKTTPSQSDRPADQDHDNSAKGHGKPDGAATQNDSADAKPGSTDVMWWVSAS